MLSNVRERGRTTGALNRRVGLEQEFFLVEESGALSNRADEFLLCCREVTEREGSSPACFAPEFVVMGLVEINTPPVYTLAELEREYLNNLRLALRTAQSLGIRPYPLGTYPLPLEPAMRDELDYLVQDRTVGPERFVHAGRCAGMHLHLELAEGTVDPSAGIAASAPEGARATVAWVRRVPTPTRAEELIREHGVLWEAELLAHSLSPVPEEEEDRR
jgi:carboxylate-amine ligase